MKITDIDIERSIDEKQLILQELNGITKFVERIYIPIGIIGLALIPATDIYHNVQRGEPIGNDPYFLGMLLLLLTIVLYLGSRTYKLRRINGQSQELNAKVVKSIAQEQNWEIIDHNKLATTIKIEWEQTSHDLGKVLVILYDGNDLLVNCRSFVLFHNPSPFHQIPNGQIIKKIEDRIKELKTQPNNK